MSNLYTNEQALTKFCPMTTTKCTGKECMLWTTYYRSIPRTSTVGFPPPPKLEATDKGYCGLSK